MLTKGIIQETLSKVVLAVAGFILNMVLARMLGPADYGVVGIVLSIMFVFELFITNGLRQAVSKILSSEQVNTRKLWQKSLIIQMAFSLVLILLGLALLNPVAKWLNIEAYKNMLYLVLAITPLKGLFFLRLGFLNGQFNFKKHALANSLYSIFRLFLVLILLYLTKNGILAVLGGTFLAFFLAIWFTRIEWTNPDSTETVATKYLLGLTWGALAFYLLVNVFTNIDVILLRGLGSTEETIGYYKASANIGSLLYFLFISVTQVSFPLLSKLYIQEHWAEMKRVVNTLFLSISYATALAFVFTFFFSELIVKVLFGIKFLPAAGVTPWYGLSIGLLSILIMLGNMMITFEYKKTYLFYLLGTLIIYLALFVVLFNKTGMYTPPIALTAVAAISIILFVLLINRSYHRVFDINNLLKNTGWLIVMSACALLLNHYLSTVINQLFSGILIFSAFALISYFSIRQVREAVQHSAAILMGRNVR